MVQETETWSPEQELRLLEEMAEAEAQAFEMELEVPIRAVPLEPERPWVAFWNLPGNGMRGRVRAAQRLARAR